ncbi:MAG: ribosomal protein S18-alanine N-acetyltransferase [Roseburia sp.]
MDSLCLPDTIFLVAEESGVIQGYIGMYLAADEGEITNVAVNPACRRRGIGEGLLTEMKKRAADHKIARIVLEVRVSNEGAIRLYEKQGFSSVGIRRGFMNSREKMPELWSVPCNSLWDCTAAQ